jgi:hypothetical protein
MADGITGAICAGMAETLMQKQKTISIKSRLLSAIIAHHPGGAICPEWWSHILRNIQMSKSSWNNRLYNWKAKQKNKKIHSKRKI